MVSDEYEPRDSVNSLTAFALNSGVYLVPFVMVPSSPIELGGNAEQKSVHITQAEGETKEGRQQEADALLNISTFPKKTQYDPVPLNTATTVFNRITMSPVIDQS